MTWQGQGWWMMGSVGEVQVPWVKYSTFLSDRGRLFGTRFIQHRNGRITLCLSLSSSCIPVYSASLPSPLSLSLPLPLPLLLLPLSVSTWILIYSRVFLCCSVTQSCLTLCDPVNYSPPGSSVHGISQARILEWVSIPFSRGSSQPRDRTPLSCIAGRFFTIWATREDSPVVDVL